jgi:NAD(P)-dependent dehydrogenase (short-subunit alcohol dehydrogenase family)
MDELRFDGRVALVTGAGRGMGRTHALLLAARGAQIIVNDLGIEMNGEKVSSGPAEEVVEEIRRMGGSALADTHDVSTEDGANAMVNAAIENFGRIDIVVHNAGIVTFIPFSEMSYAQYRKLVSIHQDGGFLVAKAAWPHLVAQKYGRLIFITSLASMKGLTHYASAKSAMSGFVRSLSAEGADYNIRSNALSVIAYTRLMAPFFDSKSGHIDVGLHGQQEIEAWWKSNLRPEQISQVVGWLAHEVCDASGETLFSAGGQVASQFIGFTEGYADADITPERVQAQRQRIFDTSRGFHIYGGDGLDSWLFDRIVSGGAPEVPPLRNPA